VKQISLIVITLIVIASIPFSMYVWPTKYSYDRIDIYPVRINRITGDVEQLTIGGWKHLGSVPNSIAMPQ